MENNIIKKLLAVNIYKATITSLLILAIIGMFQIGFKQTLPQLIIALVTTISLDLFFIYKKAKKLSRPFSAIITAFFIAGILAPGTTWYFVLIASTVAILAKNLIKINNRNVFNPTAFGLIFITFFFNAANSWWIASNIYIVVLSGLFIMYKLRAHRIILSYLIVHSILLAIHHYYQGIALFNTFIILNYFFIFFMLVDPKTVPFTRKGRLLYGALVGILVFILFAYNPSGHLDAALTGLLLGNITIPLLNKWK